MPTEFDPTTKDYPPLQELRRPQVAVDHEAGTIVWPNGADLDPDVLYELAHGVRTSR